MFPPKKQRKIEKKIKTEDDIEDFGAKEELPEDEGEDEGEDEAEGEGEVEGEGEEGENEDLDYEEEIEETVYTTSNGKDNYQKILGKKFDKSIEPSAIRPPIPKIDPKKDNLAFCQTDCDYYTGIQKPGFAGPAKGKVPIVRFYGATDNGNSVCCHVRGFIPYFYAEIPKNGNLSKLTSDAFKDALEKSHQQKVGSATENLILKVEMIERESLLGYDFMKKRQFFKIQVGSPQFVVPLRGILEKGLIIGEQMRSFLTYESNILFVLRCMIDADVSGANWLELPAGTYEFIKDEDKETHCQIEVEIDHEKLISHKTGGEWARLAPFRILSFDIECCGRQGHFPVAKEDPVIQIANYLMIQGSDVPVVKNVFVLGSCAKIAGASVHSYEKEADMLRAWRDFVIASDPDILTGYNICNFDIPYLINRALTIKVPSFQFLGRIIAKKSIIKKSTFTSKAYGTRESGDTNIEGRVQMDMLSVTRRDYKLSSYTLNNVSAYFLGEQKEEVHHSNIKTLHEGDEETRRRLAVYCLKDAYLPQRLMEKLIIIPNYAEMARVTGIPLSFILSHGQQIKVVSQLLRKAKQKGFLMPVPSKFNKQQTFIGAHVIDPKAGFYESPIATLDFASLYPSIMIAHNLCYTTLVKKHEIGQIPPDQLTKTPTGDYFVKQSTRQGLLPEILAELLEARKQAKKEMGSEKDPMRKAVLNGRQLALKISANSVYGFTGATVGRLPCLEISGSVTSFGRDMILGTKKSVEEHYTKKNGFPADAYVIYGDTDSVMVNFGVSSVAEGMKIGKEAADFVSQQFIKPIKLEFEKVYSPYLLLAKKRYAGLLWTNPDKFDKIDAKGIEVVRRDNCELVRNLISTCLNMILIKRSVEGAKQYAKSMISDLLMNRLDISMLVVSKSLSKKASDYTAKQAHVELARRMQERDPSTAPKLGDRVPYVIVRAYKGAKAYEKSEDPIFALENNIPIDTKYYLDHFITKPLMNIFSPIMKDAKTLVSGEHTRSVYIPAPKMGTGITKWATKKETCLGCRVALDTQKGERVLCANCIPKSPSIYQNFITKRNLYEHMNSRTWTHCQQCQQNLHSEVLCTNRDCPLFYMRRKVKKDLEDSQELVDKLCSLSIDFEE